MGGRTINCSFLSPPYEGWWFRTQSLLLGNPTNPSMAELGPLWLYEAGRWQIEPTKEYKNIDKTEFDLNNWIEWGEHFCTKLGKLGRMTSDLVSMLGE